MRILQTIISLTYVFFSAANAAPIEEYRQYLPSGTNLSILIQEVGATAPVVDYHSQLLTLPASTQKIITALASLLILGADYRFNTTFETTGNISNNQLQGSLIIRFSGDPNFSRLQLRTMIAELKSKGINHITGDLIVDSSLFAGHDKAPGWSWNNIAHCYNVPPSAAIIDRNCFTILLQSANKIGDRPKLTIASLYPVKILNKIRTISKNSAELRYCELDVTTNHNNYTLTGCLTQQKAPIYLSFAIQEGASYASAVIQYELKKADIKLTGHIKQQMMANNQNNNQILASIQSVPLREILKEMLKYSDNMVADILFRILGNKHFNHPGTWQTGSDAVRQILLQKADIDLANSIIADGSGLSRNNLISAENMMKILQYIAKNDDELQLINMLPISGIDGTLKDRKSFKGTELNGMIKAKTGALDGVRNLAGFMTTTKGQHLAFVQFISGYVLESREHDERKATFSLFEQLFYTDIFKYN